VLVHDVKVLQQPVARRTDLDPTGGASGESCANVVQYVTGLSQAVQKRSLAAPIPARRQCLSAGKSACLRRKLITAEKFAPKGTGHEIITAGRPAETAVAARTVSCRSRYSSVLGQSRPSNGRRVGHLRRCATRCSRRRYRSPRPFLHLSGCDVTPRNARHGGYRPGRVLCPAALTIRSRLRESAPAASPFHHEETGGQGIETNRSGDVFADHRGWERAS
jgi:hypothetical protein